MNAPVVELKTSPEVPFRVVPASTPIELRGSAWNGIKVTSSVTSSGVLLLVFPEEEHTENLKSMMRMVLTGSFMFVTNLGFYWMT